MDDRAGGSAAAAPAAVLAALGAVLLPQGVAEFAAPGPRLRSPMTAAPSSPAPYAPVRPVPSFTQSLSPSQRRALQVTLTILRSLGLFSLCLLASMCALGYHFGHEQALKTSNPVLDVAGFLVGLALLVAVFLRRRWPVAITVASALAGIGVYLDTTVGLIAFTTVVRRARSLRDPVPWATGALLAVGTLTALFRDASQASTGNSMISVINSSSPDPHARLRPVAGWRAVRRTASVLGAVAGLGTGAWVIWILWSSHPTRLSQNFEADLKAPSRERGPPATPAPCVAAPSLGAEQSRRVRPPSLRSMPP